MEGKRYLCIEDRYIHKYKAGLLWDPQAINTSPYIKKLTVYILYVNGLHIANDEELAHTDPNSVSLNSCRCQG